MTLTLTNKPYNLPYLRLISQVDKNTSDILTKLSRSDEEEIVSWSALKLSNCNPFTTNTQMWNTSFQLPEDSYVLWGGTSSSYDDRVMLYFSYDNITFYPLGQFQGANTTNIGYVTQITPILPKNLYIKATGGYDSQHVSYIPAKGVNQ